MTSALDATSANTPKATVPTPISTTSSSTSSSTSSTDNSTLSSQAFLQLLVAQLQYQDPSQPVDTSSFMNETATLSQVQTMQSMQTSSTASLTAQENQSATAMVGHTVSYTDSSGDAQSGTVSAANLATSGNTPTVTIGGTKIALSSVTQVLAS